MSVNWVRVYNRLFEIINTEGPTYFSGSRFLSTVREVDPYFPNYNQYMEARRTEEKSTSRKDYFYDILLSFSEEQRHDLIAALLANVKEHAPEKTVALQTELGIAAGPEQPVQVVTPPVPMQDPVPERAVPIPTISDIRNPAADQKTDAVKEFWSKHWQWIIGTGIAVASVIVAFVKG